MNTRQIMLAVSTVAALAVAQGSLAQEPMRPYDKTFLTNYDLLKPRAATKTGQKGYLA